MFCGIADRQIVKRSRRDLLVRAFESEIEAKLTGNDRPADVATELLAVVILLRPILEMALFNHPFRLPVDERIAVKLIATRLGNRRQQCGSGLTVLRAEILGLELIFLDGDLREGVSEITEVLTEHATMVDRVLEAHPVEENVRVLRSKRAGLELLRTARRNQGHARRQLRKAKEVALALREIFDLRRRDVRRNGLRLSRLSGSTAGDDDRAVRGRRACAMRSRLSPSGRRRAS